MKTLLALLLFVSVSSAQQFDAWVRTDDTTRAKIGGFRIVGGIMLHQSGPYALVRMIKPGVDQRTKLRTREEKRAILREQSKQSVGIEWGALDTSWQTLITLQDLQQYVRECETVTEKDLQDSLATLVGRIRVLIAQNDYASLHDVKLLLRPMGYKREPTLTGFMDWLKQRRK